MNRRTLAALVCAALAVGALALLQRLLMPKYQSGVIEGSMTEEYYRDEAPHEVLMVGDCEIYESFSPVTLFQEYGISSYLRGGPQQLAWHSYYLLEDALRYETPRVVVYNVLALKYNKPQSEAYNRMNIDGMRWSGSKARCILASMTPEEHFLDYLFPILRYHSRWAELTRDDFVHLFSKELVTHSGYSMRADVKPQTGFPPAMPLADYTLGDKAMGYLQKMADLCKEKGVALVLVKAPTEYPHWYAQWDEQIVRFAQENGLQYVNFIPLQQQIGLDMTQDTYDGGLHLNKQGAEKLSRYFGAWLKERFDLTDYRGDEAVSALWAEKTAAYEAEYAQQLYEIETYGTLVSFGANALTN
ncbi:MAG: SGNH/GDSL hydrolase family protein [Eubacteriales bacterium]|nr:SGNH/GDSL hydrolase family protein [Eubacteriales bacterium]